MKYLVIYFLLLTLPLFAAICEKKYKIKKLTSDTQLYVIIDQTTNFPKNIQEQVKEKIKPFIESGNTVTILKFSSNAGGSSTKIVFDESFDRLMSEDEKYTTSRSTLMRYNHCSKIALEEFHSKVPNVIQNIFDTSDDNIPKSDIIKNIKDISLLKIKNSSPDNKVILLVSDMIENSSFLNFYSALLSKQFIPDIEAKRIFEQLPSNFDNADLYVIGTGYTKNGKFSSGKAMEKVTKFWDAYFNLANANIKEIGQPLIMSDLK